MCRANASSSSSSTTTTKSQSGTRSMSSSKKERSRTAKPVFDGANFDRDGNCIRHKSIQLAEHVKQDGRLLWKEIKMNCPKCVAEHHKSRRVTSLGGAGKVKRGRTVHGKSNPLRSPSKSGRHMDVQFDTPFDDKGRCHHHPNVQMASKRVRGGWKILVQGCPKCIEAKYDEDVELESVNSRGSSRASSRRSKYDNDDNASASSKSTKRSVTSRTKPATSSGTFDKNGCCTDHPTVQVAKKKLLGVGGWKEFRSCPKCLDPNFDDMADNASVGSGRSNRSATSFRSRGSARSRRSGKSAGGNRSVKSNSSRKGGRKGDRYGALPFDEEGYCHAHPGVRLAKKKALGGWKVLHDICPDCAHDASSQAGSRSSKSSRGTGRYFDGESGGDATSDDASSYKSGKSSNSRKKKIRVKDMKYRDENGKDGRYSGDVDEDHSPHGQGKMKYKDGSVFVGVWSEGSQVHGKTTKSSKNKNKAPVSNSGSTSDSKSRRGDKSSGSGSGSGSKKSGSKDWARIEDGKSNGGGKKGVRKMKWMDYYGDPGEYTGEVDSSQMPNGKGSMKYDHGLIQEGLWTKGQFVEGSDIAENGGGGEGGKKYKSKSSNGGRSGANSGRKTRSSGSSSRRLEP